MYIPNSTIMNRKDFLDGLKGEIKILKKQERGLMYFPRYGIKPNPVVFSAGVPLNLMFQYGEEADEWSGARNSNQHL